MQPLSGGKRVSFQDLEGTHKEVDWDECARMATLETKSVFKARKKSCRSAATQASNRIVLVPGSMDPRQQPNPSEIDSLFAAILSNMDAGQWDSARDGVLHLQRYLKLTSGRESRERGGWKYASDFVLDTVVFGDVVRSLQSDTDVMSKAVKLKLGQTIPACFVFIIFIIWLKGTISPKIIVSINVRHKRATTRMSYIKKSGIYCIKK